VKPVQADWEIEWGGDAPIIDACWPGLVNLRADPDRVAEIVEASELPGLARTLIQLNRSNRLFWTTKCDVWTLLEFDPDELDAPRVSATDGIACYIDLLPAAPLLWREPADALPWCRELCRSLGASPLRACRADLIIRSAHTGSGHDAVGVTVYLSACGSSPPQAKTHLEAALAVFADSVACTAPRDQA